MPVISLHVVSGSQAIYPRFFYGVLWAVQELCFNKHNVNQLRYRLQGARQIAVDTYVGVGCRVSCVFSRCAALVPSQDPALQTYARFGRPSESSSLCDRMCSCVCVRVVMHLCCR